MIIGEWLYLLNLRHYVLCNRSHADAKYMPEDLTTNEVCECHYLWGKAFIDIDLTEEQNKKAHFISAWKTGR